MYIIYTNLAPKQSNTITSSINEIPIPSINDYRISNSLKTHTNNNQMRERASTVLPSPTKPNRVLPVRSDLFNSEQYIGNNIPSQRNIEFFK